jgi:hypothetical protein
MYWVLIFLTEFEERGNTSHPAQSRAEIFQVEDLRRGESRGDREAHKSKREMGERAQLRHHKFQIYYSYPTTRKAAVR